MMNPEILGRHSMELNGWLTWSDLAIWAGMLLIFAYAVGTLA